MQIMKALSYYYYTCFPSLYCRTGTEREREREREREERETGTTRNRKKNWGMGGVYNKHEGGSRWGMCGDH